MSPVVPRFLVAATLLALALLQFGPLVQGRPEAGAWFLFGSDTVAHDAIVQLWAWQQVAESRGELPLWMPGLKGGLPVLGGFLWTPFHPSLWLHGVLEFPLAQRLQFVWASWWAGLGAFWLARVLGRDRWTALLVAVGFGLCGHLVTLAHAGHLQKVLALAWLPWGAAGAVKMLGAGIAAGARVRAAAAAGLALGMMFLAGHPQVAYMLLGLAGLRAAWPGGAPWRARLGCLVLLGLVGGLVASAQFLPGAEMARWSNRAGGVPFAEAVETSYPPSEIAELVLPRFRGDSSAGGHNAYEGAWGQRLVSDYAGAALALLAVAGVLAAFVRAGGLPFSGSLSLSGSLGVSPKHCSAPPAPQPKEGVPLATPPPPRPEVLFWLAVAALSLLVGLGDHTPLYALLYRVAPGFDSFRSPGTFMAPLALALPVLAGFGLDAARRLPSPSLPCGARTPWVTALVVLATAAMIGGLLLTGDDFASQAARRSLRVVQVALLATALLGALSRWRHAGRAMALALALWTAADLAHANRAFLLAVDWESFSAFLEPDALDVALADAPPPRRVLEPGKELSLRPLLTGRDAMLGYHPISFQLFEKRLVADGLGTPAWRDTWGIQHIWSPSLPEPLPEGLALVAPLGARPGGVLLRDDATPPAVRRGDGAPVDFSWLGRAPNAATMDVREAGEVVLAENASPGWQWRVDGGPWMDVEEVALERRATLDAPGLWEMRYRPFSHRAGVFLTALGLGLCVALGMGAQARSRR